MYNQPVIITATNRVTDIMQGSAEERTLFRVMPVGGSQKLYFDNREQYDEWATAEAIKKERLRRALQQQEVRPDTAHR